MNPSNKKRLAKYDRVMSRLLNRSRTNVNQKSNVTRHGIPSSVSLGAKPSGSNVNSSIFNELPVVLNDYSPDVPVRRTFVVKPRRTVKSLDPPHCIAPKVNVRPPPMARDRKLCNVRAGGSAPVLVNRGRDGWSDTHLRECLSSRSHNRLKELKDEIREFRESDKQKKLRSRLFQSCGVVLDDLGHVTSDKAVQVERPDPEDKRSERGSGEDARAPLPDEQMRLVLPRYPVDRYLVESSKKIEMVNIIDDDIWNPEPALRPDDELVLRKLHDMLQSTAGELTRVSGELARLREPVRRRAKPAPLDDEFNEKLHIEELVNAKFHGYKIVEESLPFSSESKPKNVNESLANNIQKTKVVNAGIQVNPVSSMKKTINDLQMSRTRVVHIKEDNRMGSKDSFLNNGKLRKDASTVHYNEIVYKYEEPKNELTSKKQLQVQKMPDVNIRSELKEQKVLQLDIMPETKCEAVTSAGNTNVGVIAVQHEAITPSRQALSKSSLQYPKMVHDTNSTKKVQETNKQPVRITTKMSTCESSESTCNNISSDAQHRLDMQRQLKFVLKNSPKSSARVDTKNKKAQDKTKKDQQKRPHSSLDEWKKKLNAVYGQPSQNSSKKIATKSRKVSPGKSNITTSKPKANILNNAEYIPYSQLTLGGVRVSDIEKEISDFSIKKDVPLTPILDKILSSRENSFHKDSPRKFKDSPKVLTTSDENLLQEVIDIEKTVNKTLAKSVNKIVRTSTSEKSEPESEQGDNGGNSYADDFEDDKSDRSGSSPERKGSRKSSIGSNKSSREDSAANSSEDDKGDDKSDLNTSEPNMQNTTYTKVLNLSFKNSVDVFEFVHSIDTQETGTQSNSTSKISLKETQTSPRNERSSIQPIHNDLWPSIDPKGEVENMFQLEKDFIKKLILDEYGDILEKNITKPSTSHDKGREDRRNNAVASQKITQTSPAHVKSVMTSPTRTKARTTSPFSLSLTVDRQTSPMIHVTQEEEFRIEIDNEAEDLGISINLSSPRFSLRLPQNSREVLSNLDDRSQSKTDQRVVESSKTYRKHATSSSSSVDGDNSSEISSLGEVRMKLKKKHRKSRISSESSYSSVLSRYSSGLASGEILPLKSEGEVSFGQVVKRPSRRKRRESDGEMAL